MLFSNLILLILGIFIFIGRASMIYSRCLLISCAIMVVFSTRIFPNLDLGIERLLRYKAREQESLRCIARRLEGARDNFGKFIYQLPPKTKTLVRKLERILLKLYRQNVSLLFNQTYIYIYIHTYIYIYIYIYIEREREREKEGETQRERERK